MDAMENKVIYISGKMAGPPDLGRARFAEAEQHLTELGYTVLNPAKLPVNMPAEKYMPICFAMIDAADGIYMLSNYFESLGAKLEMDYAVYQGKELVFEATETKEQWDSTEPHNGVDQSEGL